AGSFAARPAAATAFASGRSVAGKGRAKISLITSARMARTAPVTNVRAKRQNMTAGWALRMREEEEHRERLLIRLFGPLEIEGARKLGPRDFGGSRPKQVLEILLAARGHRVPTDRLADLLWGEALPRNAAGSLQTFVSVLR